MSTPSTPNRITRIAIVGANGTLGQHITTSLLATHHTITALTRTRTTTFPPGVAPIVVDYTSPASLISALENHQVLIITLSASAPAETHSLLVSAAAKAGVEYIIPNAWAWYIPDPHVRAESIVGDSPLQSIQDVETHGLKWIAVCCSFWYEYSLSGGYTREGKDLYGFDWEKKEVWLLDGGERKINTTTWAQVGRAVAALLSLDVEGEGGETLSAFVNRPVRISSFWISQREMLESVRRVTGEAWAVEHEGARERYEKAVARLRGGDRGAFGRAMYSRIFCEDAGREGMFYASLEGCDNERLGLPVEDLDEATARAVEIVKGV
ncbi:hypothetical protein OQA88_5524 [Cercophora sp. LCS_1]